MIREKNPGKKYSSPKNPGKSTTTIIKFIKIITYKIFPSRISSAKQNYYFFDDAPPLMPDFFH
jgi:hypothetical protein